ncbi:MAG TPA: hypothetical protein VFK04_06170 [Gemmatimonadaceae bacterium]|nr:hypothetical protein [Gemmatimonadaceae bacterium]
MLDNTDPMERTSSAPPPARRSAPAARPPADREVPIEGQTAASINAWLDGDVPESAVRGADTARDVDFWLRIEKEVEVRRDMKTPAHVYQQIMESLPEATPRTTAWYERPLTVSPMVAITAAAAAVAVGIVIGIALIK